MNSWSYFLLWYILPLVFAPSHSSLLCFSPWLFLFFLIRAIILVILIFNRLFLLLSCMLLLPIHHLFLPQDHYISHFLHDFTVNVLVRLFSINFVERTLFTHVLSAFKLKEFSWGSTLTLIRRQTFLFTRGVRLLERHLDLYVLLCLRSYWRHYFNND